MNEKEERIVHFKEGKSEDGLSSSNLPHSFFEDEEYLIFNKKELQAFFSVSPEAKALTLLGNDTFTRQCKDCKSIINLGGMTIRWEDVKKLITDETTRATFKIRQHLG